MRRLLLASSNAGKLRELRTLLAPVGVELVSQGELGLPDAPEPHATFLENALAKARHASALAGLPALGEDSGLSVDALGGAPGVHSARYAGEPRSDERNNRKLLDALAGVPDRSARYHCTLVLVRHAADPCPLVAQGDWEGSILEAPRGSGGFGYDPLFLGAGLARSAAELAAEEKNAISHRGQALVRLLERLRP